MLALMQARRVDFDRARAVEIIALPGPKMPQVRTPDDYSPPGESGNASRNWIGPG